MRYALLAVTALVVAGCNLDVAVPEDKPSDPATETFASSLNIDLSKMTKTAAGTYYKDVKVGTGAALAAGNANTVVVVSYLGLLKNGSPFAQVISETVALNNLVGGLQDAMPGMQVGGERIIVVPSSLGYGNSSLAPVPPNSTLVFDVVLDLLP